ncbi:MAG: helix-turn-helix transcriptional regulator [Candidimonas sp.]|jgi:AraC-like DNA-binding protein
MVKQLAHTSRFSALQLDDVSIQLGISKKRISNAFQRLLGLSAAVYLRNERMLLAQRLLTQTSLATEDIAVRVGFSNSANFSNAFRKHCGMSPTRFRNTAPLQAITSLRGSVAWAMDVASRQEED